MPAPSRRKKSSGSRKASSKTRKRSRAKSASSAASGSSTKAPTRQPSIGRRSSSASSKPAKSAPDSLKRDAAPQRKPSSTATIQEQLLRGSAGKGSTGKPHKMAPSKPPKASSLFPIRIHHADDEYSSRELEEIHKRHEKVALAACVAIVALVVVLALSAMAYALVAPKGHKSESTMRGLELMERMEKACKSDDCRTAVASMEVAVDATVDPCEDFYHYACGHWRELDDEGEPMSYEVSVRHHYVLAVHGYLTDGAPASEQCHSDVPSSKIVCVYASCVAFFTNRSSSLSSLLTAADLNVSRWMRAENFVTLFTLVVRTAFRTRLSSVLSVERKNQSALAFEFGTCFSCCSDDSGFPVHLLDLAAEVLPESQHVNRSDVLRLDAALREISRASWNLPVQNMDAGQFDVLDRSTWQRVLAEIGAFSSKPEHIQMVSANPRGVVKIVTALNSVPLAAAKLYTLLASVAPYIAVEFFEAGRRHSMKMFRAWQICVDDVAFLFTDAFDGSFSSAMGTEKAAVTFRNMRIYIRLAAVKALHLGKDLELNKEDLMADDVINFEDMDLDDPAFSETYGEDFLANLILYHRNGSRRFRAAKFRSDTKLKTGGVPTNYFLPDYYYSGASEQAVNSGTLGVLTAAILFNIGIRRSTEPVQYAKCFAQYARDTLKLPVNNTDWHRHTRVRWAVETAFEARQSEHDQKELDAMHYMRFARTYCGEKEEHILPMQFSVLSSENFNRTFECEYKYPVMAC